MSLRLVPSRPTKERCHTDAPHRGLTAERARVWFRRLLLLSVGAFALLVVLMVLGWPAFWLAPLVSFTGAEITRRIMAEQHPDLPMRWRDILRFTWDVSHGRSYRYQFCGPPKPTPAQRRAQLRLVPPNTEILRKD